MINAGSARIQNGSTHDRFGYLPQPKSASLRNGLTSFDTSGSYGGEESAAFVGVVEVDIDILDYSRD